MFSFFLNRILLLISAILIENWTHKLALFIFIVVWVVRFFLQFNIVAIANNFVFLHLQTMVHFSIFPVAISLNCIPTIICYCCILDAGEIKEENKKKINQIISKMKRNKNMKKYKKSSKKQQDQQHFNIHICSNFLELQIYFLNYEPYINTAGTMNTIC